MSNKSNAPFSNPREIALRKVQLRKRIKRQENLIGRDLEAYREDVDTLKRVWSRISGITRIGSGEGRGLFSSKLSKNNNSSGKPVLLTALSVGAKVARWLWKRRKR